MMSRAPGDSPNEIYVGAHLFRWEPPDTGYICYRGDLDGPAMIALRDQGRQFAVGQSRVFMLVQMAHLGKVSMEARRQSAQGGKGVNMRGIAVVSASAPLRLLSSLVSRAFDLLNGNTDNPTRFFETESEARAWIAARRTALQR